MNNARSGSEIVDILCGVKGIDVNPKDYLGRTPLMVACITGNEAAVRSLCAQPEIDLYCRDNEGKNPEQKDTQQSNPKEHVYLYKCSQNSSFRTQFGFLCSRQ